MRKNQTMKLVTSALLLAVGLILPFITMQIPQVGNMLLPMHIPVILCGFICGGWYGFLVGLIVPLLRSLLFGMPPLMPVATAMSLELATYGLMAGVLYRIVAGKRGAIYTSLIGAMIAGRVVWGITSFGLYSLLGKPFTWKLFMMGAVVNAVPGIVLQVVFIPIVVIALKKSGVLSYLEKSEKVEMKARCAKRFEPVIEEIERLVNTSDNDNIIIAIDGLCASGKTTLAYYIQSLYDCNLFHMDDFFLREEQKTKERENEIGGNVDYERFKEEVLDPLVKQQDIMYSPYSCKEKTIGPVQEIKKKRLNIIEGSYSLHPYFESDNNQLCDLKIFTEIDASLQRERIKERNGEEQLKRFIQEWIPKETAYFKTFKIKESADLVV